jgi:hypothetical protein
VSIALFVREVEDQDSKDFTLNHPLGGMSLHQPIEFDTCETERALFPQMLHRHLGEPAPQAAGSCTSATRHSMRAAALW